MAAELTERARRLFAGSVEFMLSAPALKFLPEPAVPEVALAGRSNVGKSSLLNAITGRTSLARTSVTPGRTQELNFFAVGTPERLRLVDMPGYGFAKAPPAVAEKWRRLVRDFLRGRQVLKRTLVLIDARHGVKPPDKDMMAMLDQAAVGYRLVLTKARREEHAVVRRLLFIAATLRLTEPLPPPDDKAAASGAAPAETAPEGPPPKQTCRWTYRAFLQRQICFTSMTGLSSCTQPEIVALPDSAEGDAPLSDAPQQNVCNDIFRPAVNARIRLSTALLSRSKDLFASDQSAKVDPQFKAAGVKVAPEPTAK